jgi:hypothetical protein
MRGPAETKPVERCPFCGAVISKNLAAELFRPGTGASCPYPRGARSQ